MLAVLLGCGLRRAELVGLKLEDLIGARLFWALDVVFSFDEKPCMRPPSRKYVIG
jgi:integrase